VKEEKEKYKCQFCMYVVKIRHENTFCIKKMHLDHLCPPECSSTRVINSRLLSNAYVGKFRSNPNTCVTTFVDKANKDSGVDVPKRIAYIASTRARNMVTGPT
jgi:hypothetical protein